MTVQEILTIAQNEVGITEYPPNSNCVKYNDWYYNKPGISGSAYPWCCAFIAWLFRSEPTLVKRTASCSDMLAWFLAKGQIVNDPQPGDIVFFRFGTTGRPSDHIGIVKAIQNDTIITIEGNTSINSNDNGGAVMERNRNKKNIVAYARPSYVSARKSVEEVAREIWTGKGGWGNNPVRRQRLIAAGYNPQEVQAKINELYYSKRR